MTGIELIQRVFQLRDEYIKRTYCFGPFTLMIDQRYEELLKEYYICGVPDLTVLKRLKNVDGVEDVVIGSVDTEDGVLIAEKGYDD